MVNLFDKNIPEQAYHTKERPCPRGCGILIYFECRFDEQGNIITKDGKMPNGIFGKENNVKWFWRESLSKSEHLIDGKCRTRSMSSEEPPTEAQVKTLKKFKIYDIPATKQEASDLIGAAIAKIKANKGSKTETEQKTFGNNYTEAGVKWEEPSDEILAKFGNTINFLQEVEAVAVHEVKSLHPNLSPNSNTFGQIVSVTMDRIIQSLHLNEYRALNENISRIYDKLGK